MLSDTFRCSARVESSWTWSEKQQRAEPALKLWTAVSIRICTKELSLMPTILSSYSKVSALSTHEIAFQWSKKKKKESPACIFQAELPQTCLARTIFPVLPLTPASFKGDPGPLSPKIQDTVGSSQCLARIAGHGCPDRETVHSPFCLSW